MTPVNYLEFYHYHVSIPIFEEKKYFISIRFIDVAVAISRSRSRHKIDKYTSRIDLILG